VRWSGVLNPEEDFIIGILNCVEKISIIAANLFVCAGVIFAGLQWCLMKKEKRQSTIEFYNTIRNDFINSLEKIDKKFPNDQVIKPDDIKGRKKLKIRYAITEYLSCMERFAVGINRKIYDIEVFNETVGATLTKKWYKRLEKVIDSLRDEYQNPKAYKNLGDLIPKLICWALCTLIIFDKCSKNKMWS